MLKIPFLVLLLAATFAPFTTGLPKPLRATLKWKELVKKAEQQPLGEMGRALTSFRETDANGNRAITREEFTNVHDNPVHNPEHFNKYNTNDHKRRDGKGKDILGYREFLKYWCNEIQDWREYFTSKLC